MITPEQLAAWKVLRDAQAENDRLRAEVSDLHDKLRVVTEQNDALGDANVAHVERDAAMAEASRMRAVYEAAKEWRRRLDTPENGHRFALALADAIDAALAAEGKS